MKTKLIETYKKLFGSQEEFQVYFAPGRVNLIGEHTDYNGGHVFPCSLTLGTYGIARKRTDNKLRFYSLNFEEQGIIESDLNDLIPSEKAGWTNYPKGVIWAFEKRGYKLDSGLDIMVCGDIPSGAGLSSSAALEVLIGLMLKDLFGFDVSMTDIALIGQYAENNFNGINCGIMDQFTSAMGKKGYAIFLDTNSLDYKYAPITLENAKIVIVNSKVKHSLVNSEYNTRRKECEMALEELQQKLKIHTLGDLSTEEFEANKERIQSYIRRKRAKHAIYENQRTIKAVEALGRSDLKTFGKLMNESHISLRDDYEVSCPEVDFLVEYAWQTEGVIGSRITGGGFGGCTVSIVENDCVERFTQSIKEAYKEKWNREAEVYTVNIGDGAKIL